MAVFVVWLAPFCQTLFGQTLTSGKTTNGSISVAGGQATYSLNLTAGNSIVLQMAALSGDLIPDIRFYDPQDNLLADYWNYTAASLHLQVTGTGTYTVVVRDVNGVGTGAYQLEYAQIPGAVDAGGGTLNSGQTLNNTISVGGFHVYAVSLTAGNSIVLQMAALSGDLIPDIRFYDPQGNLLADYWNYTTTSLQRQVTGTGTYTVVVRDVNGVGTGAYQLEYAQIPGAVDAGGGTLNSGQTLTNTISVGSFHVYAVSLTAGNSIVLQMAALSGNLIPDIRFYDPQGNLLNDYWNYTTASLQRQVTGTGTYTVVVRDVNGVGTGAYQLEYAQIPGAVDAGGGTLNSGQTLTNTISVGSFHVYAVSLTAGNSIVLQMAALSGNLIPDIRFYDPQGNLLADYWNYTTTSLQLQVTGTGTYTVVARDANGVGAGAYSLTLSGNITPNSTLRIVQPPVNQTMKAGMFVQFTVAAAGASPIRYQWQFKGQNIPNATNATLTFNSVTAANSGGYSVIVSNPYGSVTSATASLAVLTDGANGNKPVQITVPTIPPKPSNKDSLVVITHGWEPLQPNADLSWMTAMSNAIQSRASSNWAIANFVWLDQATFPDPDLVLCAAETKGRLYGQQLAAQGWKQIHFIGHSAGAALIQVAAAQIPLSTTVQCTFLDPYVGLALQLQSAYGSSANWADCYFTQDFSGGWTGGDLPHAYNVDVDWLDPNHETFIYGSALIAFSPELNTESHGYSHEFYTQSVTNNPTWCSDAAGYGFTLSEEAGGQTKWSSHPTGNNYNPYVLCGPPNAIPSPPFPVAIAGITIDQVSHAVSDAATAIVNGAGFLLSSIFSVPQAQAKSGGIQPMDQTSTNTPAWLAVGVTVTNAANFVQFDAGFTDTNAAQGLLTVYWNTNQVGIVDERVANTNLKTYRFSLPGTVSSGLYTLSFRLDSFVNSSSIAVTNMATGFVGVTQPITLAISLTNGSPMVRLTAATNFTYLIQSSTNLMNWSPTALLLNTNGNAQFLDSAVTNSRARFYRAVLP